MYHYHQTISMHIGHRATSDIEVVPVYEWSEGNATILRLWAGSVDLWPILDAELRAEIAETVADGHAERGV